MNVQHFFLSLFVLVFGLSASGQTSSTTETNIPYYPVGTAQPDDYLSAQCVLDLHYPKDTTGFATVVWFHGGGLTGGAKELPEGLCNRGIAVAGVGYRLSPMVAGATCIHDAAAAVAWVFRHIAAYGGDPSRIFVSGHSAGGYLAAMVGLDKRYLAAHGIDANRIAGLIPLSAQAITHFTIRRERGVPDTCPVVDEYAPLHHVRKDAPPLLLITGDRDLELWGRYEENAYLARMMQVVGHTQTRLLELDGYGHDMVYPALPLVVREVERQR